jgi:hypothetical protein
MLNSSEVPQAADYGFMRERKLTARRTKEAEQ